MQKYISSILFAALFISVTTFSACSLNSQSFVETTYDSLKTANTTVDQLMVEAGEMYQKGEISDSQKEKIDQAYKDYRLAADLASSALAAYERAQNQDNKQTVQQALEELDRYKSQLRQLTNRIIGSQNETQ